MMIFFVSTRGLFHPNFCAANFIMIFSQRSTKRSAPWRCPLKKRILYCKLQQTYKLCLYVCFFTGFWERNISVPKILLPFRVSYGCTRSLNLKEIWRLQGLILPPLFALLILYFCTEGLQGAVFPRSRQVSINILPDLKSPAGWRKTLLQLRL